MRPYVSGGVAGNRLRLREDSFTVFRAGDVVALVTGHSAGVESSFLGDKT